MYLYPATPLAAGGARERRNYKQQGARSEEYKQYKQLGTLRRRQRFWRLDGCNLELVSCRFSGSEGSVTWCFAVAKPRFWRPEGCCNLELFQVDSESDVRQICGIWIISAGLGIWALKT
jgi:hypothetical protein